jgi:hypothetical protein
LYSSERPIICFLTATLGGHFGLETSERGREHNVEENNSVQIQARTTDPFQQHNVEEKNKRADTSKGPRKAPRALPPVILGEKLLRKLKGCKAPAALALNNPEGIHTGDTSLLKGGEFVDTPRYYCSSKEGAPASIAIQFPGWFAI